MPPRRPPDILRKSHAHSAGDIRSRDKRELARALDETLPANASNNALLIDLDGVVYADGAAITGAAEAIGWLVDNGVPHLFVTNTTSRSRAALVEKLSGFGIAVSEDRILAPADAACDWLRDAGCRRLQLLVPASTAVAFNGFEVVGEEAPAGAAASVDAVVVGDLGRDWTFDRLNSAFRCLMQTPAPKLVALGMTRYWRAADGLRLDTAPFVMALAHASGIEPVVLGKPAPAFFAAALGRLGITAAATWMLGDDVKSDVGGAQAAGMRGILVRTGKFRPPDLAGDIKPDLVIDSIADLPRVWLDCASS